MKEIKFYTFYGMKGPKRTTTNGSFGSFFPPKM
jgi:hypothetical protein